MITQLEQAWRSCPHSPGVSRVGGAPATLYRRRRPDAPKRVDRAGSTGRTAAPASLRALSAEERAAVLGELHSARFADAAPAQVWATLLDEGRHAATQAPQVTVGKSTYARCGIITNVTPFEPEWEGYGTLEISNTTPLPAKIYSNEGIAQVLFVEGNEPSQVSYKDRGGKYQSQVGVTLPRL